MPKAALADPTPAPRLIPQAINYGVPLTVQVLLDIMPSATLAESLVLLGRVIRMVIVEQGWSVAFNCYDMVASLAVGTGRPFVARLPQNL